MKKLLSKSLFGAFAASVILFSSCSRNSQSSISSIKDTDIQWKSTSAVTPAKENLTASTNTENLNLTKEDFKLEIKNQFVANNPTKKLTSKEEKQLDKIASKLEKKFNKLSPKQKLELKEKAESMKSNEGGIKKAVVVSFVGLVIMAVGIYTIWLIWLIGLVVLLYGLYLLLDELVF